MLNEEIVYLNLRNIAKIIKRRLYIILIITCITVILGGIYNHYKVKYVYAATSSLVVGVVSNGKASGIDYNSILVTQNLIKTYSALASTKNLAQKTINKMGLDMPPEALQGRIVAQPRPNTQILDLSVTASNSELAYSLIQVITDQFIDECKNINPSVNLQYADLPRKISSPIGPSKKTNLIVAFALGIVLALAYITILEYLDMSVKTEEDIKRYLDIPVLESIPKVKGIRKNSNMIQLMKYNIRLTEAINMLRIKVQVLLRNSSAKTISITGAMHAEGRTTTAAVLATSMAEAGNKVVLVDCDFRQPSVHRTFLMSNLEGVSDILNANVNIDSVIRKSSVRNLDIITAGTNLSNPHELISSNNMTELIYRLKRTYDYVIFDTPPVMLFTDALVVSQNTDVTLMVMAWGKTDRRQALKLKQLLENVNGKILGVTLNQDRNMSTINYDKYYKQYIRKSRSISGDKPNENTVNIKKTVNNA